MRKKMGSRINNTDNGLTIDHIVKQKENSHSLNDRVSYGGAQAPPFLVFNSESIPGGCTGFM